MFLKFQVCSTRYAAAYFYVLSYLILIIIFDAIPPHAYTSTGIKLISNCGSQFNYSSAFSCLPDLGELAISSGMKEDLNFLPRSWMWIGWMKTRNPNHQTIKGWRLEAKFPWLFALIEKFIYQGCKNCKKQTSFLLETKHNKWKSTQRNCLGKTEARQRCPHQEKGCRHPS